MELLESYRKLARTLGRERFIARFPHPFLIKRPALEAAAAGGTGEDWDDRFSFRTNVIDSVDDTDLLDEEGPAAAEWRVVEVRKREGNPFPDRISVGRTKNCDVTMRFPSVSKLHAHFLVNARDRSLRLTDALSANGTCLNGRSLATGESAPVKKGDRIRFGVVDVELIDAPGLFAILAQPS